jgi:hypothetical protein
VVLLEIDKHKPTNGIFLILILIAAFLAATHIIMPFSPSAQVMKRLAASAAVQFHWFAR